MSPRVRELQIRYTPHPSGAVYAGSLSQPKAAAAVVVPILEDRAEECALVLLLTTRYQLIAVHELARGTLESVDFDPRTIFRAALLANAPAIILAHNHPSGDPTPSQADIATTRRLIEAGRLLGVEVLDHVIVGDRQYSSLKEQGIV